MDHISPAERERVVQLLAEHFAQDHLSLEEYERRVTEAYRARGPEALSALTKDLAAPVLASPVVAPAPAAVVGPVRRMIAFMSGVVRRGIWTVPARVNAAAIMGGVDLDLREATLTAPVTEIYAVAIMGGVVITAPPNVRIESDGFAIMGGFEDQLQYPGSSDPAAPVIRVRGFAIMGGVEVKVKEPKD